MLSKDITIINGMVRTKDSLKVKDADRNLYIEKEGSNYNGYILGVSGEYPQYIMKKHGVPLEDIMAYAKSNGLTITDLKVRDSKTKDAKTYTVRSDETNKQIYRALLRAGFKEYKDFAWIIDEALPDKLEIYNPKAQTIVENYI